MKISLNSARLGSDKLSFAEFVGLAAKYGFDAVDFGTGAASQLIAEQGGASGAQDFLAEKGVALGAWGLDVEWRKDDDAFTSGMASLAPKAALMQSLHAPRCVTWMPPSSDASSDEWRARTVRRFAEIARVFADHEIHLGLEWVGPHHLRAGEPNQMGANPTVWTLPQTLDLIREIGAPNVGLLVDCYHCHTTGAGEADIAALTDDQIVHVHVNDAPKGTTPETARDGERVLPGAGVIDLPGFLRGLRAAGYTGFVAAEVLAPQNLAATPDDAARMVRESLRKIGL